MHARFPFQIEAAQEMALKKRCINKSKPGFGKTLETQDALQLLGCKRVLVICLNGLKTNWEDEITKWYPDKSTTVVLSNTTVEERDDLIKRPTDYTITSFNQIIMETKWERIEQPDGTFKKVPKEILSKNFPTFMKVKWDALVIDEAHTLRGRHSKCTNTVLKFAKLVDVVFLLTGTMFWKNELDVFPLLKILDHKKFSSYWNFVEEFFTTKINYFTKSAEPHKLKSEQAFTDMLSPYVVGHTDEKLLGSLPSKSFIHIPVDMLPKQRRQYNQVLKEMKLELAGKTFYTEIDIVKEIRLRQICLTANLILDPNDEEFSELAGNLEGAKFDVLYDLLESFGSDKVVIFSIWAQPVIRLLPILQKKYKCAIIHGGIDNDERTKAKQGLQEGDTQIMLCSMAAGGVGLTLTAANRVVFLNTSRIPAENEQAYKRVHRLTQTKPVFVYNIYCRNSIEEKVMRISNDREALFTRLTSDTTITNAIKEYINERV